MLQRFKRQLTNQRGQSMVEFAILAPVLALLLAGMLEFGLVFHEYLVVTGAAREGARSAAVGAADAQVVSAVKAAATTIDNPNLTIEISPATRVRGNPVTVTVTNPVTIIAPIISVFFPSNPYNVTSTAVMRME